MDKLIRNFVNDPDSPVANFELAAYYESIKHYAGAISHFLKCAECGDKVEDESLIYESLIHIALGFRHIGTGDSPRGVGSCMPFLSVRRDQKRIGC